MTILTGDLAAVSRSLSDALGTLRATVAAGRYASASASWTGRDGELITLTLSAGDPPDVDEDDDDDDDE